MKVILLRDIRGVGRKYEEKSVSDGYAINMLIPKKLAVAASGPGAKLIQEMKKQDEAGKARGEEKLHESLEKIAGKTIALKLKANEKGGLFSAITAEKLSKILHDEQGIDISSEHIRLSSPIKEIGTYEVPISIRPGVETKFSLTLERL